MTYLLDTVAVSALRLPQWNPSMARWASGVHFSELWISTLTIGEVQQGIVTQPDIELRHPAMQR